MTRQILNVAFWVALFFSIFWAIYFAVTDPLSEIDKKLRMIFLDGKFLLAVALYIAWRVTPDKEE